MMLSFIPTSRPDGKTGDAEMRRTVRKEAMKAHRRKERIARVMEFRRKKEAEGEVLEIEIPASVTGSRIGSGTGTRGNGHRRDRQGYGGGAWGEVGVEGGNECQLLACVGAHVVSGIDMHGSASGSTPARDLAMGWCLELGGGALDPFGVTTLREGWRGPDLFQHFVHKTAKKLQPVGYDLVRVVVSHALEDPVLLSAILFHAALHADSKSGNLWSPVTLYHRGEALKGLNRRLQRPQDEDVCSDSTLAAVGYMSATGDVTGEFTGDRAHLQALQTMVKMRGGLDKLGWNGALALLLSVGDILNATISFSRPSLSPPTISPYNPFPFNTPPSLLSPPPTSHTPKSFCEEILVLTSAIRELSAIQASLHARRSPPTCSIVSFMNLCAALEYRLLGISIPLGDMPDSTVEVLVHEAARSSLCICMNFAFRDLGTKSPLFIRLQQQLRPAIGFAEQRLERGLEREDEDEGGDGEKVMRLRKMRLWVLWVGALVGITEEWCGPRIVEMMRGLGMWTWEEVLECLEEFVWCGKMSESLAVKHMWDRVEYRILVSPV
ncbi:hypothetical protein BCR34DRAFT_574320 [Clohesyomyces aquaticus]|uniref:Uncharacterized protein n=1 Tax=Clohesyomyces aquaticus TaxID=1231657 RepID=A0A1Y1YW69_9PLEO|nr:hypothetical protein BCR34DRAFT_574320 [Clohesyomyces aquaticus]